MQPATFEIRSAFGQTRAYPASPAAEALCNLTGSKTLLPQSIGTIRSLGFICQTTAGEPINPSDLY
jgi:hypothetical protein